MEKPDVFSVPRRFDLATVLVAMAAFALLFACLQLVLDAPPTVVGFVGGFLALVAAGQWIGSKWNSPRAASVVAGILAYAVAGIAQVLLMQTHRSLPQLIAEMVIAAPIFGGIAGYLGGALVGGIFLVSHYFREWLGRNQRDAAGEQPESESPWEEKHPLDE